MEEPTEIWCLPRSEWMHIFLEYLALSEILLCRSVSKLWLTCCDRDDFWSLLTHHYFGFFETTKENWKLTFRTLLEVLRTIQIAKSVQGTGTRHYKFHHVPHSTFLSLCTPSGEPSHSLSPNELFQFLETRFGHKIPLEGVLYEEVLTSRDEMPINKLWPVVSFTPHGVLEPFKGVPLLILQYIAIAKPYYYEERHHCCVWILARSYFVRLYITNTSIHFPSIMPSGYF
jgi:hypothetical protein